MDNPLDYATPANQPPSKLWLWATVLLLVGAAVLLAALFWQAPSARPLIVPAPKVVTPATTQAIQGARPPDLSE